MVPIVVPSSASDIAKIVEQMRRAPTQIRFADLVKVCMAHFGEPRQRGTSHAIFKTPWLGDHRVTWSREDNEYVGLCVEFSSLSWLAKTPESALAGIRKVVASVVADMQSGGEAPPQPLAERQYSGEFRVRIPPHVHRALALEAAEQGISLNRLASAKLTG